MGAGRPRAFNSPDEMQGRVDLYFAETERVTMAGLCIYLGIHRDTWSEYGQQAEYSDIVKMARYRVEAKVEELLLFEKAGAGAIFWLKNHAGYSDKTEQDVNVRGEFYVSDEPTIDEFDEKFAVGTATGSADSPSPVPIR